MQCSLFLVVLWMSKSFEVTVMEIWRIHKHGVLQSAIVCNLLDTFANSLPFRMMLQFVYQHFHVKFGNSHQDWLLMKGWSWSEVVCSNFAGKFMHPYQKLHPYSHLCGKINNVLIAGWKDCSVGWEEKPMRSCVYVCLFVMLSL